MEVGNHTATNSIHSETPLPEMAGKRERQDITNDYSSLLLCTRFTVQGKAINCLFIQIMYTEKNPELTLNNHWLRQP